MIKVNENILLGAGGDYGDFQYVKAFIDQKMYVYFEFFILTSHILFVLNYESQKVLTNPLTYF